MVTLDIRRQTWVSWTEDKEVYEEDIDMESRFKRNHNGNNMLLEHKKPE